MIRSRVGAAIDQPDVRRNAWLSRASRIPDTGIVCAPPGSGAHDGATGSVVIVVTIDFLSGAA
jgi:hypothetical protein